MFLNDLFLIFVAPFLACVVLIKVFIKFSEKTGMFFDVADADKLKIHTRNISILGGLAIIFSALATQLFYLASFDAWGYISGLLIIFLILFFDDIKWKHNSNAQPLLKALLLLVGAILSAVFLFFSGISFQFIPIPALAIFFSFITIFLFINSINYQDGIDGLAGSMVFISLVGFLALSMFSGNHWGLAISGSALSAVLAFLVFNFPPAKIFMGDSGAYSLGFILAVLALLFLRQYNISSLAAVFLIGGMPLFDGIYSNLRRIFSGKSLVAGDRSHFYDKMIERGFSVKKTLLISAVLQALFVVAGIIIFVYA